MENKIQKFLIWLTKKTREKKVYWRQERWGSEFFTCSIQKESGKAVISLISKNPQAKDVKDLIIKIEFYKGPPVGPVSFLFGGSEAPYLEELPALYGAVKEVVKPPEWLGEWIDEILQEEEIC